MSKTEIVKMFGPLPSAIDASTAEKLKKRAKEVQKRLEKGGHTLKLSKLHLLVANALGYRSWQALHAMSQNTPAAAVGITQEILLPVASSAPFTRETSVLVPKRVYAGPFIRADHFDQLDPEREAAEAAADSYFERMAAEEEAAEAAADAYLDHMAAEEAAAEAAADAYFDRMASEEAAAEAAAEAYFDQVAAEESAAEAAAEAHFDQVAAEESAAEAAAEAYFDRMAAEEEEAAQAATFGEDDLDYDGGVTSLPHWTDAVSPDLADFADENFDNLEDFEEYMESRDW